MTLKFPYNDFPPIVMKENHAREKKHVAGASMKTFVATLCNVSLTQDIFNYSERRIRGNVLEERVKGEA